MALSMLLTVGLLAGCSRGPTAEELAAVDCAPGAVDGWSVSTPEEHDLDPDAVAELFWRAEQLESIQSLLVIKGGEIVAMRYFNFTPARATMIASRREDRLP